MARSMTNAFTKLVLHRASRRGRRHQHPGVPSLGFDRQGEGDVLPPLLTLSSVYLALVGLGFLAAPDGILFGTLGAGASTALLMQLRGVSGTFIGIAIISWSARNAPRSPARDGIVLGSTVGYAIAGILSVASTLSGAPAAQLAPAIINLLFAGAFAWAGRTSMSKPAG